MRNHPEDPEAPLQHRLAEFYARSNPEEGAIHFTAEIAAELLKLDEETENLLREIAKG